MDDIFVIDFGAVTLRAGRSVDFPCDNEPRCILPSQVLEEPETSQNQADNGEACSNAGKVEKQCKQIFDDEAAVQCWEGYEALLHHVFYEQLGWPEGDEGYVIATEAAAAARLDRERAAQLMFETFNVMGHYLVDAPVASLYAVGKTQGVVADVGHTGTDITQVLDGAMLPGFSMRLPLGGKQLRAQLRQLMAQRSISLSEPNLRHLQEHAASVYESADAYAAAASSGASAQTTTHTLPDGQTISITTEGFALGEALIAPALLTGSSVREPYTRPLGLAEAVYASVMTQTEPLLRKVFFESVLVCGGCSNINGLAQRVQRELRTLAPPSIAPALILAPEYMPDRVTHYSSYVGASILGKVINPTTHFVSKTDYEECGPSIVHRKC